MLKFLFGVFIGWVLFSGDCDAADIRFHIVNPPPASECIAAPLSITAMDALSAARKLMIRDGWEYGGAIYEDAQGRLCPSAAGTSKYRTKLWSAYNTPAGYKIVAIYHTHPGEDGYENVFSGVDAHTSCKLVVPSFIVTEQRSAYRFDPGFSLCLFVKREDPYIVPGRFVGLVRP